MHLGITGTRNGLTRAQFDVILTFITEDYTITHLHQGDAIGVDYELTCMFQEIVPKVIIIRHPPINDRYQAFGPYDETWAEKWYLDRDQDNVDESDYLWGCPKGTEILRSGTWATIRYARTAGIPITIVMPDGEIIYE